QKAGTLAKHAAAVRAERTSIACRQGARWTRGWVNRTRGPRCSGARAQKDRATGQHARASPQSSRNADSRAGRTRALRRKKRRRAQHAGWATRARKGR
ncbi:Unknown protein, partial [Striga hermonthica]